MSGMKLNTKKDPMESLIERSLAYFDQGRALTNAQKTAVNAVKSALDAELNALVSHNEYVKIASVTKTTATLFNHPKKEQPTTLVQPVKKAFALS